MFHSARLFLSRLCSVLSFGVILAAGAGAVQAQSAAGWQAFWQNHNGAARAAFQKTLVAAPNDLSALRGLGLVEYAENDEADAARTWRKLYHVAPGDPLSLAYWPYFVETASDTGQGKLLAAAGHDILAAPSAPVSLRASARLALANQDRRSGDLAAAEVQWQALGYLRAWQVIGPFDNASQSGVNKRFGPEDGGMRSATYVGKDDQTLPWRRLLLIDRDGQCEIGHCLGDHDPDVYYAVTILHVPSAQEARFQFDPTGASQIAVNGKIVFADSLIRAHAEMIADPFSIPVSLHPGSNTVLVKIDDDSQTSGAFSLRVTSPTGSLLPQVTDSAWVGETLPSVAAAPAPSETAVVLPPEDVAATVLRAQGSSQEAQALLVGELTAEADNATAEDVARTALQSAPQSGWLHWDLAQALDADGETDDAVAEWNTALTDNPRLVNAALAALRQNKASLTSQEYIARLKALHLQFPKSADILSELAQAYDDAQIYGDAVTAARQAAALSPGDSAVTTLAQMCSDANRSSDQLAVLTQALKAAPGSLTLLDAEADAVSSADSAAPAISFYSRELAEDPSDVQTLMSLAQADEDAHADSKAVVQLRQAIALRPQDGGLQAHLADLLQEDGHRAEAIRLYGAAIRLDPANLDLRDKLAVLSGAKPVIDLAPATPSAPILAAAAKATAPTGASALVLLDEGRTVVYPDYATISRFHQIIKVFDQAAVDRYQSYPLEVPAASATATVESARLLKADGKVQDVTQSQPDADSDSNDNSVAFPSLAPGDVIDITYRVENYQPGALAHQFWTQWFFNDTMAPNDISRYALITPVGLQFTTQNHGAVPAPSVHDVGGWRIREWRMSQVPRLAADDDAPGLVDRGTWLDISTISSWSQIVSWYRDLSDPRCIPDAATRAKALELTQGCTTDQDKLRAIVAYVSHDIQYQSSPFRLSAYVPTEAKEVMRERYGDCKDKAALLTSLLAAVGIHSDMVLLSPRSHGLTSYLPSPRFNHAIACVQTAQGPLWVDGTADQLTFGDLPADDQQVPALVIAPDTTSLTQTPELPITEDTDDDHYTCTIDAQDKLTGSVSMELHGMLAWAVRSMWRQVPADKQDQALRIIGDQMLTNSTYDSGGLDNLADTTKPLILNLRCHADGFATTAGDFLLSPMPWNDGQQDDELDTLKAEQNRTQDLEVADSRGRFRAILDMTLPDGYVPQDLPTDVHADSPYGSYQFTYQMHGNVLHAEREMTMTALRIPAASVPQYTAFLEGLQKEVERKLVFKKGA